MRTHADWGTEGFDRLPPADHLGPFPQRSFLEVWWKARGSGEPVFVETDAALMPLWHRPGGIEFLGEADLTDYHAPLGGDIAELAAGLTEAFGRGTPFRLDSLPAEVADPLEEGLTASGVTVDRSQHEVAAVLDLSGDYDAWLGGLSSKERHEVRRKRRRFEERCGPARLVRDSSPAAFESFVQMHRSAPGDKGGFMTPDLEGFFSALLGLEGAVLDLLVGGDGDPLAAAFGFEDEGAYYLYNSAYLTEAGEASPGVTLVDRLLAGAIEAGRTRFDFLKGDERYKFKMGAEARPLFALEGVL